MRTIGDIKTIGLGPSWDTVCRVDGIEWGDHKVVDSTTVRPAGKAMNIAQALSWMGRHSTAAGLWGAEDIAQARAALRPLRRTLSVALTEAAGATRRNITVVDTAGKRELHLRHVSSLATVASLRRLRAHLRTMVGKGDVCVFAGMMPDESLAPDVDGVIAACRDKGGLLAVDTSGAALRRIVRAGRLWLIKPNVEELCELLETDVPDRVPALIKAARGLLEKVETVLITRGAKGAVVVTRSGAWQGRIVKRRKAAYTVGCGDYFLAGYLHGLADRKKPPAALESALIAGTARAWGLADSETWEQAREAVEVRVELVA